MRKYCFCCALAMAFYGCSTRPNNQMVKPLPSSYQIDNLKDAEVATSFSANDFSWKDGKLSMDVFSEDLYDSAEVSKLKAGDTLIYIGEPIVVKDVNFRDSFVTLMAGLRKVVLILRQNDAVLIEGHNLTAIPPIQALAR